MLISKLNNITQGPQTEIGIPPNNITTSYVNVNNSIRDIQFNGDGISFSLTDYITEHLNNKLNITEEKLKLTMDEIIQACQEKYPYKVI